MLQVRLWFKVQRPRRFHQEQLQLMKGHAISFFENAYRWEKEELFTGFHGDKLPVVSYNMTMFETVSAETQRLQAIWRKIFCRAYRCQSMRSRMST